MLSLESNFIFLMIFIPPSSFFGSSFFGSSFFGSSFFTSDSELESLISFLNSGVTFDFSSIPIFILEATFFSTAESSNAFSKILKRLSSILVLGLESIS